MQGSTAIQPSEVSDNGQFTGMRFPNQRELPAFFVVNPDGSEAIASFDVRDEYVVLHGAYRTIRLRRGLEVLCIHNQKTDYLGPEPTPAPASGLVDRTKVVQKNECEHQ